MVMKRAQVADEGPEIKVVRVEKSNENSSRLPSLKEMIQSEIITTTRTLELERHRLVRLQRELDVHKGHKSRKFQSTARSNSTSQKYVRKETEQPHHLGGKKLPSLPISAGATSHQSTSLRSAMTGPLGSSSAGQDDFEECPAEESLETARTTTDALKGNLDFHRKKLSTLEADNLRLRKQINRLRKERMASDQIFNRFRRAIKERTKQLEDFVEEGAESKALVESLDQRKAVLQQQQAQQRLRYMSEILTKRGQFNAVDTDSRQVDVSIKNARVRKVLRGELVVPEEEASFSEGSLLRAATFKTAFLNCIQRKNIEQHQKTALVFETAFSTIKHSTGIEQIEDIVKIFMDYAQANYSLVNFVNSLHKQIESIEITQKQREEAKLRRRKEDDGRQEARRRAVEPLEERLERTLEENDEKLHEIEKLRAQLRGIEPLVLKMAEQIESVANLLREWGLPALETPQVPPATKEVSSKTVAEWLMWLERALGKFREAIPQDDSGVLAFPVTVGDLVKALIPKKQTVGQQAPKTQELPSTMANDLSGGAKIPKALQLLEDDSDEEDGADRPLHFQELKAKAVMLVEKRRAKKAAALAKDPTRSFDFQQSPGQSQQAGSPDGEDEPEESLQRSPDEHLAMKGQFALLFTKTKDINVMQKLDTLDDDPESPTG
eukprot:TRINITY_DN34056_c0_g1_i1.p1 TRINITY_DN34056_c0_g1~~TRINITY_DN34056_c0_g1_i1.p1  ORF type:complete len:666 (-),score=235.46 TRINITY_DN34056_c0_g1_i1:134-2131(-)